jgi:hypothetical protein
MSKPIEINKAKEIANEYNYDEVIILAIDNENRKQHVTTFGKKKSECIDAANIGNEIKRLMGWPEKDCNAKPNLTDKIEE